MPGQVIRLQTVEPAALFRPPCYSSRRGLRACGTRRSQHPPRRAPLRSSTAKVWASAGQQQPEDDGAAQPGAPQDQGADGWKSLLGEGLWAPAASNLKIGAITADDLTSVADIQAASFHTPMKLGLLNAVAYNSFRAEIRGALAQKFKYGDPRRFCCLVARNAEDEPIGVVEVSLQREEEVLARLESSGDAEEYAYISSMAVREQDRRSGVASAMLSAAEQVAGRWGQAVAVLDVHEDNAAAVRLYELAGYQSNSGDPNWVKLVGKRKKLHMQKPLSAC